MVIEKAKVCVAIPMSKEHINTIPEGPMHYETELHRNSVPPLRRNELPDNGTAGNPWKSTQVDKEELKIVTSKNHIDTIQQKNPPKAQCTIENRYHWCIAIPVENKWSYDLWRWRRRKAEWKQTFVDITS